MEKRITAPKYFLKIFKEGEKVDKELGKLLGLAPEWFEQVRLGGSVKKRGMIPPTLLSKVMQLSAEKRKEIVFWSDISISIADYAWSKFRLNNMNNEFGRGNLTYDWIKEEIVLKTKVTNNK